MQVQSDSVPNLHKAVIDVAENIQQGNVQWNKVMDQLMTWALDAGRHILIALVVYIVGHYLIKLLNYLLAKLLEKRKVEVSLQTFLKSFVSILLQVLLIVTVVGALGVKRILTMLQDSSIRDRTIHNCNSAWYCMMQSEQLLQETYLYRRMFSSVSQFYR